MECDATPTGNFYGRIDSKAQIIHADATTTDLGLASGARIALNETNSSRFVTKVNVAATKIKAGESLRMISKVYGASNHSNKLYLWTDAGNRFSSTN